MNNALYVTSFIITEEEFAFARSFNDISKEINKDDLKIVLKIVSSAAFHASEARNSFKIRDSLTGLEETIDYLDTCMIDENGKFNSNISNIIRKYENIELDRTSKF